jgi:hypothetical protein
VPHVPASLRAAYDAGVKLAVATFAPPPKPSTPKPATPAIKPVASPTQQLVKDTHATNAVASQGKALTDGSPFPV